jgi:hypothetical protein
MSEEATKPQTRRARDTGDDTPTTLHYVDRKFMQEGRNTYAMCGRPMQISTDKAEETGNGSVICPLCDFAFEQRRHGWPNDPRSLEVIAMAMALELIMDHGNMTVPEVADKMNTDPDRLNRGIHDGSVTMVETAWIANLCGLPISAVSSWARTARATIQELRDKDNTHE